MAALPKQKSIRVLDCFSADGKLWDEIRKRTTCQISITRIEKREGRKGSYMQGDNRKFLMGMNIDQFDLIDLDAFGVPFDQLEILWPKFRPHQTVVLTFIQSGFGQLPKAMLLQLNITHRMYRKCPILCCKNGYEKLKDYLAIHGIKKLYSVQFNRKIYSYFRLEQHDKRSK